MMMGNSVTTILVAKYLIESARERAAEMAVFAIILATSAWPVIRDHRAAVSQKLTIQLVPRRP